jgi:TetR/AcrR family transcriptional regulator, lmrAB and yxaGH operons repressor
MARLTAALAGQKRQTLNAGLINTFRDNGYDGASLTALSAATGLAKASLYHRFPDGKPEMGRTALAEAGRRFTELVLKPLQSRLPARERLHAMVAGLLAYYADSAPACLMNTMTLGSGEALFGTNIRATMLAWQRLMESTYIEIGESPDHAARHAQKIIITVQGTLVLARIRGDIALAAAWADLIGD